MALGTVIDRITEVLICLIYSLRSSDVRFRIKYFFAKSGILFLDFMKIATPAVINDVVWSFANATTIIVSQELGKDNIDAAREYGKRMLSICLKTAACLGILCNDAG